MSIRNASRLTASTTGTLIGNMLFVHRPARHTISGRREDAAEAFAELGLLLEQRQSSLDDVIKTIVTVTETSGRRTMIETDGGIIEMAEWSTRQRIPDDAAIGIEAIATLSRPPARRWFSRG